MRACFSRCCCCCCCYSYETLTTTWARKTLETQRKKKVSGGVLALTPPLRFTAPARQNTFAALQRQSQIKSATLHNWTEHFTVQSLEIIRLMEFYAVQKGWSAAFEVLKSWNVWSGLPEVLGWWAAAQIHLSKPVSPTCTFTVFELQNPPIVVHKLRRLADSEALNLWKVRSRNSFAHLLYERILEQSFRPTRHDMLPQQNCCLVYSCLKARCVCLSVRVFVFRTLL